LQGEDRTMRDPEQVARAQRAAARLELAWEHWRGLQGLADTPAQPVVGYVGYALREPWGQPRAVIGFSADEAERLADFLEHDGSAVYLPQLSSQQLAAHPSYPFPAQPASGLQPSFTPKPSFTPAPAPPVPTPQRAVAHEVPAQLAVASASFPQPAAAQPVSAQRPSAETESQAPPAEPEPDAGQEPSAEPKAEVAPLAEPDAGQEPSAGQEADAAPSAEPDIAQAPSAEPKADETPSAGPMDHGVPQAKPKAGRRRFGQPKDGRRRPAELPKGQPSLQVAAKQTGDTSEDTAVVADDEPAFAHLEDKRF
jgi:hypothetical protein